MSSKEYVAGIEAGQRIKDRYEIKSLLGKGGFASVFRAFDIDIERPVAIKVLNLAALVSGDGDREVVLERFRREAKLAARVSHPSVVQIHDYGVLEEADNPFIIMEVLEGHDLEDELEKRGPLSPERFIPLFVDALEALGEAHQLDIVHKDLKPSNLFLANPGGRRETLKVVDFGIAYIGDDESDERLTRTGFMLGTPQYVAPEYVEEQSVSPALDVYQMALILVELLAGQAVVGDTNPWRCAMRHVGRELSVPGPLLDSPLGPVIEQGLALDPADRFADAGAFAEALEAVDVDKIPYLTEDVQWRQLPSPGEGTSVPDKKTRELFEEAQAARQQVVRADDSGVITAGERSGGGDTEETLAERDQEFPLMPAVGAVALMIVVAALAFVYFGDNEDFVDDELAQRAVDDDSTAESDTAAAGADEGEVEELDEASEPDEEPVFVELDLSPSEATVEFDGEVIDEMPPLLRFDSPSAQERLLAVEYDGYEPFEESVGPKLEPTMEIDLVPMPKEEGSQQVVDTEESQPVASSEPSDEEKVEAAEEVEEAAEEAEEEESVAKEDESVTEKDDEERRDVLMAP